VLEEVYWGKERERTGERANTGLERIENGKDDEI
jgi:hypothetical protein